MNDGYRSRKFWFGIYLSTVAHAMLMLGLIEATVWLAAQGTAISVFTMGNIGEKFAPK